MAEKAPAGKKGGAEKKESKSALYESKGEHVKRTRKFCPKCGPGVFLAQHSTRESCGNCGFSEWKTKAQ